MRYLVLLALLIGVACIVVTILGDSISTHAPAQAYSSYNSVRVSYASLGLTAVCDLDITLRDPASVNQILATYSSDGTHYSAAGQIAAEHAWEATLGL